MYKEAVFSFAALNDNGKITISMNLDINTALIAPENYENIKEFFIIITDKENEKIVLKKK